MHYLLNCREMVYSRPKLPNGLKTGLFKPATIDIGLRSGWTWSNKDFGKPFSKEEDSKLLESEGKLPLGKILRAVGLSEC